MICFLLVFQEDIEQSALIPLTAGSNPVEEQSTEDSCDITPAYKDLVVSRETKLLEMLNIALKCFEKALEKVGIINNLSIGCLFISLNPTTEQPWLSW